MHVIPNEAAHRYTPSYVGRYDMGCVVSVSMHGKFFKTLVSILEKILTFAADLLIPLPPFEGGNGLIVQGIERKFPKL